MSSHRDRVRAALDRFAAKSGADPYAFKGNPGSPGAVQRGCTCPVLDNRHGEGIAGSCGEPIFTINATCPLHAGQKGDQR